MNWMDIAPYIGRTYESMDCWELVRELYVNEFNIKVPRLSADREMIGDWVLIRLGYEKPGDVLVFKMGILRRHVGVVIDPTAGYMLHTESQANCHVEKYTDRAWKDRIQKIYRHKARC